MRERVSAVLGEVLEGSRRRVKASPGVSRGSAVKQTSVGEAAVSWVSCWGGWGSSEAEGTRQPSGRCCGVLGQVTVAVLVP